METQTRITCYSCGFVRDCLRCDACKIAPYCGKECQRKDWQQHKLICKVIIPHPNNPVVKDFPKFAQDMFRNVHMAKLVIALSLLKEVEKEEKALVWVPLYDTSTYSPRTSIIRNLGGSVPSITSATFFYAVGLMDVGFLRGCLRTYPAPSTVSTQEKMQVAVSTQELKPPAPSSPVPLQVKEQEQDQQKKPPASKLYYLPLIREDGETLVAFKQEYKSDPENAEFNQFAASLLQQIRNEHATFFNGGWLYFCMNALPTSLPNDKLTHLTHWGSMESEELCQNVVKCLKKNALK